jgi:site-specific DNA-methyltransferase (adenine-specific)
MTHKKKVIIGDCVLYLGDCLEVMPTLGKVDCVITDPPYLINLSEWDKTLDIPKVLDNIYNILPNDAWFIYFGQMPTLIDWQNEVNKLFKYSDHISWVKRRTGAVMQPILRSHESIMINKKGKPKYFETKMDYGDKSELLYAMPEYIEGFKRALSDAKAGGKNRTANKIEKRHKEHNHYNYFNGKVRSPENVNITNVWCFLPDAGFIGKTNHPTQKPIKLMSRLILLLSEQNQTILDPFAGSFSTGVACVKEGRKFIGIELDEEYFNIGCKRIEDAYRQADMFTEQPAIIERMTQETLI